MDSFESNIRYGEFLNLHGLSTEVVDSDHDGIEDVLDNCPILSNSTQIDTDGDGDGDNDGMPDLWEIEYFFNPLLNDADYNYDGDGYKNLEEFLIITDAWDSKSTSSKTKAMPWIPLLLLEN